MQQLRESQRLCSYQYCGNTFEGRSDKMFCSDQCRNRARRDQLKEERWNAPIFYSKINEILQTNHRILQELYTKKGDSTVVTDFLLRNGGFNFEFITRTLITSKGIYRFCFDYGWLELENGKILIVKNEKMILI
ncbi:hypothetical protein [Pedobacter frigidisoli]|uniref:hypothetical protein n=1 Tax=Pedobacter frigidisoli TaxID=2530455 RepID=UPI00292D3F9F|nr:hypothetical protein [Pedobacter frigidisoli]